MVDHEERVRVVDNVLVDGYAIEVLLQDGAQVAILRGEAVALALDGHHVEQHFVVPGKTKEKRSAMGCARHNFQTRGRRVCASNTV